MALPTVKRDPVLDRTAFNHSGCSPLALSPSTPDSVRADIVIERHFFDDLDLIMPDGNSIRVWGFFDPQKVRMFPNEIVRVQEGQTVHTHLTVARNSLTIHHHGIEPTPFNDGAGNTSFEVNREFTYQWLASRSGTYFYHSHKNAVLLDEMGVSGFLIVDPVEGEGFVRRVDEIVPYQVEALWHVDDFDPRWHGLDQNAGRACPFEIRSPAALHLFQPKYFLISGIPAPLTETEPAVVVEATAGDTILLRLLNASYTLTRFAIKGLDAEVVEVDGRTLGRTPESRYSKPFKIAANSPFELSSGQRWALLLKPRRAGRFPVEIRYQHWITRKVLGVAKTFINVS